jgi:hypothetical protein
MLSATLLSLLTSLSAPSYAGTLQFAADLELTLRRTADGYSGAAGPVLVTATVGEDGSLVLMDGKTRYGTVRRTPGGFELERPQVKARLLATTLRPPDVHARGPKVPQVTVPVVPGVSLGVVKLGQSLAGLKKLGPVKAHPSGQFGDAVQVLGPYTVTMEQGKVSAIEVTPSESDVGLVLPWMAVAPSASIDEVARAASGCSAKEGREGGTVITCKGVLLKEAASCRGRDANGVCEGWAVGAPVLSVQVVPR